MPSFDSFGFNGETSNVDVKPTDDVTDLDTGKTGQLDANGNAVDDITGNGNGDSNNGDANKDKQTSSSTGGQTKDTKNPDDATANEHDLEEGTIIEDGDNKYTVDKDGNLIDDKGNIFKAKNEVAAYLKEFEVEDTSNEDKIDVKSIQELVGISVTSEDGKPVTFDNTPQGVASYVQSVLDLKRDEFAKAGVNKLFEDYPVVSDFLNYYVANGNSFEGFGELRDRSGIEVDENNVSQQEAIVREAFKEFNRRGNVDKYIQYLKDSNELFNVAKEELEALQKADNDVREANAKEALRVKAEEEKQLVEFWNGVKECIDKRQIAGYRIPETVIIERNGKQISTTPEDFFNYVYQVDDKGLSRYENDLMKLSPAERRDEELLKAWLKYTGKGYDSLIEMAVSDKEAKKLKLTASQRKSTRGAIKITKPDSKNDVLKDERFGY
ncbi:hypothetical protein [uncultured phage cr99_1]|uniref:Uncharacterized protein n=1 Tax=uncultured phage cr99_1 TaxID=2986399 RepID=A0AAE7RUQ7_9CAUD|nr:hypothetical protein M1M49_gp81 [uncultured phage cr99_1]QWM89731.1 hypothetical protein [uncultured phage cr99_1]